MTYNLYNFGWLLDDVERDYEGKWEVNPSHGINESFALEAITMTAILLRLWET